MATGQPAVVRRSAVAVDAARAAHQPPPDGQREEHEDEERGDAAEEERRRDPPQRPAAGERPDAGDADEVQRADRAGGAPERRGERVAGPVTQACRERHQRRHADGQHEHEGREESRREGHEPASGATDKKPARKGRDGRALWKR
jgi:hypothetical protein